MGRTWGQTAALTGYTAIVLAWACWIVWVPARLDAAPAGRVFAVSAALTYRVAGFVCHQHESRSFHWGAWPWPVCARCSGLYAGGAMGALAVGVVAGTCRRRGRRVTLAALRAGLIVAAVPTAGTWMVEHVFGANVPLTWRAVAALPLGAAVSALVAFLLAGGRVAESGRSGVH